jgi:DNA-binding GntR family transcriptional regulator
VPEHPTAGRHSLVVPSLVDALYEALRTQIFSGEIAAGESVTELGVAERFSVARPTAKAAVERLVHDGLLDRSINKTARVRVLEVSDVDDLYRSRAFLEREMVQVLASQRLVPDSARQFVRDLQASVTTPRLNEVLEADVGFHRALFDALGSPRLTRLHNSLMGEAHLCMAQVQIHQLLHPETIAAEHVAIVEAIESGDQDRALAEITRHLEQARDRLVVYLLEDEAEAAVGTGQSASEARIH